MQTLQHDTFRGIAALMHQAIGLSLPDSKRSLVESRLASRLQRLDLDGYEQYLDIIASREDAAEFQMAVDLLTTNETYFFREQAHFDLLQRELNAKPPQSVAVWSAASSFGDEAYSVAMLLADMQRLGRIGSQWSVLGTDISDRVLQSAASGIFPQDRLREVPEDMLKRYALRGVEESEGQVQMQPKLRERVRFGQLNLCEPVHGIGPFDVIFLRNVLIYFDAATKTKVVDNVLSLLRPGGLFFIGTAEGRVPCKTPLQPLAVGAFRKTGG